MIDNYWYVYICKYMYAKSFGAQASLKMFMSVRKAFWQVHLSVCTRRLVQRNCLLENIQGVH